MAFRPRRRRRRLRQLDPQEFAVAVWRALVGPLRAALLNSPDGVVLADDVGLLVLRALVRLGLADRQRRLTKAGQLVRQFNLDIPVEGA